LLHKQVSNVPIIYQRTMDVSIFENQELKENSRSTEFWTGVRDQLPILLGTMPFGMIYGVLAVEAGLEVAPAIAMSSIVFAGSAQFIATQLFATQTPPLVILITTFVINLRHALYSASLAPYLKHLSAGWKALLAYLLTDETYAVAITRYARDSQQSVSEYSHWYFLGCAFTLWSTWQLSTAVGVLLGATVPESWSLDFTLPLVFIAIVIPNLTDRPALLAAVSAGTTALLAAGLPFNLGLIVAAVVGIAVGIIAETMLRNKAGEA